MNILDKRLSEASKYIISLKLPEGKTFPSYFIVGSPRSGTTLLYQSLAFCTNISYIDNLIARYFWLPELGVTTSHDMDYDRKWTGQSFYGKTKDISEPHEFGRFWRDCLGYSSMFQDSAGHDLAGTARRLEEISSAFGSPTLYKVFLLSFHIEEFHNKHAEKSKWIYVERDPVENARSILDLRRNRGKINEWSSLVPQSAFDAGSIYDQVIAQVLGINSLIEKQLSALPPKQYYILQYDRLCDDFSAVIEEIGFFLGVEVDGNRVNVARGSIVKSIGNKDSSEYMMLEEALSRAI